MKRYLGLESKSLGGCRWPSPPGLGTDNFVLGFGICVLNASALWRIPLGAMTSVTFNRAAKLMLTGQGRGNDFFIVRAGCSPPFLLPLLFSSSFPFPSPSYPVL